MNGILKTTSPYVRPGAGDEDERTRYSRHIITSDERECGKGFGDSRLAHRPRFNAVVLTVEDCDWYGGTADDRQEIVMTAEEAMDMAIQLLHHAKEVMLRNAE